ncbi:unnamed protein product [Bubo scandiacus]
MMSCSRAARDRRGPPSPPIGRRPSPVRAAALPIGRRLHPATAPWKIINNRVKCGAGRGWEVGEGRLVPSWCGAYGRRHHLPPIPPPAVMALGGLGRGRSREAVAGQEGSPGPGPGLLRDGLAGRCGRGAPVRPLQALPGPRPGKQPLRSAGQRGEAAGRLRALPAAALGEKPFLKECWD